MGLVAKNLTCIRNNKIIFKNLSFTLPRGTALLLHGSNGSGKSSLLRILAGLSEPADGNVFWLSDQTTNFNEYIQKSSQIHYLTSKDGMKEDFTVLENLCFWSSLYSGTNVEYPAYFYDILKLYSEDRKLNLFSHAPYLVSNKNSVNYILMALEKVNLLKFSNTKVNLLSSGQRKRLGLAKLISIPAPLWLLDEPTLGLDSKSVNLLSEGMRVHQMNGGSIILVSHLDLNIKNSVSLKLDNYGIHSTGV